MELPFNTKTVVNEEDVPIRETIKRASEKKSKNFKKSISDKFDRTREADK